MDFTNTAKRCQPLKSIMSINLVNNFKTVIKITLTLKISEKNSKSFKDIDNNDLFSHQQELILNPEGKEDLYNMKHNHESLIDRVLQLEEDILLEHKV